MASVSMGIKILEQCNVAPSPGAATELVLPLVFSDIVFLPLPPQEHLIFYTYPCSESHFSETIVPNLKNSLSLTLKNFPPFAGNIIFPLTTSSSATPVSHYVAGDSISLTIALSKADLIPLTGNLSKDADQFHDSVALLPPPTTSSSDSIKFSVAAVKVTLFPNQGICIGITHHHAIADGSTILAFMKAWASINKFNGDDHLSAKFLPFYDRNGVETADATLSAASWNHMRMRSLVLSSISSFPTNKLRATFVLSKAQIETLKSFVVMSKKPISTAALAHVSSFVVVCAHVWTCIVRSSAAPMADDDNDDQPEYFNCVADCRRRLIPPLPDAYFGNCLALVLVESTRGRLKGDRGIVAAAEAIGEAIQKVVSNDNGILEGYLDRFVELERVKRIGKRVIAIAGTPRFDVYAADFGWGKPIKFELAQINFTGSVCLCKSREYQGGIEIGLSMSKVEMDAFAVVFDQGLREATENTCNHLSKL